MISKTVAKTFRTRSDLAVKPARSDLVVLAVAFLLSLALTGCSTAKSAATAAPADSLQMSMLDSKNEPENLKIKLGQTVTFKNNSSQNKWPASNIHPTHGIYEQFDPKAAVPPGQSWSFTFERKGIFPYHDHLDPSITGIIEVE